MRWQSAEIVCYSGVNSFLDPFNATTLDPPNERHGINGAGKQATVSCPCAQTKSSPDLIALRPEDDTDVRPHDTPRSRSIVNNSDRESLVRCKGCHTDRRR